MTEFKIEPKKQTYAEYQTNIRGGMHNSVVA